MFRRSLVEDHRELIGCFHNAAGGFAYFRDEDVGALVLEEAADTTQDAKLKLFLYTEAFYRAQWCAQAATAGGEGASRSQHVHELQAKMADAAQQVARADA
jgi:hypothetical protein